MHDAPSSPLSLRPVTVISTADGRLIGGDIVDEVARFSELYDVYAKAFVCALVIQMPEGIVPEHSITSSPCEQYGLEFASSRPPSGPYLGHENGIHEAWRLYLDQLEAFEFAVILEPAQRTK